MVEGTVQMTHIQALEGSLRKLLELKNGMANRAYSKVSEFGH